MISARPSALLLTALLVFSPAATSQEELLQNDSLVDGGPVAVQLGFIEGETGAAVLAADPGDYPVTIKNIQVFIDKTPLFPDTSMTVELLVWDTATISGTSPTLGSAVYTSPNLQFGAGFMNEWDIEFLNIQMSGPFTVGCRIIDSGGGLGLTSPSMVTDTNGCQGGKNYVLQTNGVWANLCSFGVSGDLVIRSTVITGGSGSGQFIDLGNGLAGGAAPVLSGSGSLAPGGSFDIDLSGMPPFTQGPLFVGFIQINAPFKGGVLVPQPFLSIDLPTGFGTLTLGPNSMPPSVPSNFSIYLQAWFPDGGAPQGVDATNGLELLTP
jgi:hypothetical protein